jgi:ribose transport system permease protein
MARSSETLENSRKSTAMGVASRIANTPVLATLIGCVAILLIGEAVRPGFISFQQISGQLTVASILALVAAGQGLAILSGREGLDLSVGSTMSLAALVAGNVMDGSNAMIIPAMGAAVAAGFAVGVFNGIGITVIRIAPLVMTLGTAGVITGLLVVLTQGQTSGSAARGLMNFVTKPVLFGLPGVILIFALTIALLHLLLRHTRFGYSLYAVGSNDMAAALSGVRVRWIRTLAYGCSGAFAGFAGFVLLGYTGTVFVGAGEQYILPSVIAVVIGGTSLAGGKGTFSGTAAGAIFLTLLTALLTSFALSPAERQVVFGAILILFMMAYGRE